jgi:hypothetical protein
MLQHEREKEGDEFADKDRFVTEAYKRQMEEVRRAEDEEKARDGELVVETEDFLLCVFFSLTLFLFL